MDALLSFFSQYGALLAKGTWDSFLMTALSTLFAYILGTPLGVLLIVTKADGLHPNKSVHGVLGWIINVGRSIPFIILIVFMFPFTRAIVGTSLGTGAAIVPLTVAATPLVARMVEQSLEEVDAGLIEAAQSFGARSWQIITKVSLHESLPSLIRGASIVFITVFGYAAMAGTVGGGGIGDIAIRYGYQRYQDDVMIAAIIISIVLIQVVQMIATFIARKIDHKN